MKTDSNKKPRWWLYCEDLEFARLKQWNLALNEDNPEQQANELAIMTYLGVYSECEEQILKSNLYEYKQGRDALYRARRALRTKNTWESLINRKMDIEATIREIDKKVANSETICVKLVGGIGDQLEATSLLMGQKEKYETGNGPRIKIKACGDNHKAVDEYLQKSNAHKIRAYELSTNTLEISYPLYRYWLEKKSSIPLVYQKLCDIKKEAKQKREEINLLVCWRCKINRENLISSFSRSVPFNKIMELIRNMIQEVENDEVKITDITKYNSGENKIISQNYPKIRLMGDTINSIDCLVSLIAQSDIIVSVDTSLIHISATCNREVNALLPQHADERWIELMESEGIYKQNVAIHKQRKFNSWDYCGKLILNKIKRKRGD